VARGAVLRIRDFRLLFAANSVSVVGNAFTNVALAFGVLDATGSAQDVGIVLACRTVAQVAFMLLGGAWGDRVSRRTLLVWTDVASACTQAAIAALFLTGSGALWSLSSIAAVNGAVFAVSAPAAVGVIPQVVPDDLLQSANALSSIVRNSATIGGSALAGALVAAASPGWALVIDAVSFLVAAMLIRAMSALPPTAAAAGVWAELREGWREFVSRTWVWAIVVQFAVVNFAFSAGFLVYAPIIAKADLGGPAAYGVINAAIGIGGVLGGLVMLRYRPRLPMVVATLGIAITVGTLALLAAGAPLAAIAPAAVVEGVGAEVFAILWTSALQQHIPPATLARVSAYDWLGSIAFVPAGLALAGTFSSAFGGVHAATWAVVVMILAPTLAVLAVPDVWRLRLVDNTAE